MHQLKKKEKKRNLTRRNQTIKTYNSLEEINTRLNQNKKTITKELGQLNQNEQNTTKKSYEEIEQFDKIKTRVLKYVFYKKRTAEEVRRKFEGVFDEKILDAVIENLIELGYINDNSYIDKAINEYMAIKDMSLKEIKYKLLSKGLKSNSIDEYFQQNHDILKEYEIKSAKNLISKKSRTMDETEIKGFLLRKGYSSDSIKEAIN